MSKKKRKYSKEIEDTYDRIIDGFASLEIEGITIMTGSNGSGKSLIRKQIPFAMKDRLDLDDVKETQGMVQSTSMDARTGSMPEMGALSAVMRDTDWFATSQNTLHSIEGLLDNGIGDKTKYIIIDEFEIGCGEETVLALVHYLNKKLKSLIKNKKIMGAMIITHSRLGVKNLNHDAFINLDGMNEEEWLNREIVPTDLKKLKENELFFYIRDQK